jgi:RNA polymerase sigma factor (sigma-70 family)
MACSERLARALNYGTASSALCPLRWEDACQKDTACLAPLSRRLDSIIRRQGWSSEGSLSAQVVEECRQELLLLLWRIQSKLDALPQAEQEAYAVTCLSRAAGHFLQREHRHSARSVSLHELTPVEGQLAGIGEGTECDALFAGDLLQQMSRADLAEALCALSRRDYTVLDLYYREGFTDAQIATHLNLSAAAVRVQRSRVLTKLRKWLRGAEAPSDTHPERSPQH